MLHTYSLPPPGSTDSDHHLPAFPHHHNHMVMREGLGGHDLHSYDLDHHVRHKPLKRRGLSKF